MNAKPFVWYATIVALLFACHVAVFARDLPPTVTVIIQLSNATDGGPAPGCNVYLEKIGGGFMDFAAGTSNQDGTVAITAPMSPGQWYVDYHGGSFKAMREIITIVPGKLSYAFAYSLPRTANRINYTPPKPVQQGERALTIRVRGRLANGQIVPVHYATIYSAKGDSPIATTNYDGLVQVRHNVPLGETMTLRAEATKWRTASSSFIAGASEGGTGLTRADDYINFMLNGSGRGVDENIELFVRVVGRTSDGTTVPVRYATIYDAAGQKLVMTGYDGRGVVKRPFSREENHVLTAEANHWKTGTTSFIVGEAQEARKSVTFVLESDATPAPEAKRPLTVHVLDRTTDKPIPAARVTLFKPVNFPGTAISTRNSDAGGEVVFDGASVGQAQVDGASRVGASAVGYETTAQTVAASFTTGGGGTYTLYLKPAGLAATPKPTPTPRAPAAGGATFGLVSKVLGHAPGPAEGQYSVSSGSMSENSFHVELRMKPPSTGFASVTHHFSSPLTSFLLPGQVVELTCTSEATRQGRDTPYVGSNCQWYVEGDGAAVLDSTKTFVGTAGDGKFYPGSQAVTHFRVLKSGTIKITAAQGGALWGSSDNWNPATYIYKSGAAATTNVGGPMILH